MDVQVSDRAGMMWLVSCACAAHESSACLARCIAYLVDPASSHMLVSKIKPCMSQFFYFYKIDCKWLSITVTIGMNHYLCG